MRGMTNEGVSPSAAKPRASLCSRKGNRFLGLLRADDLAALEPYLEFHPLKAGATLLRPDVAISHMYFVIDGMVSLVQLMECGKFTETAIVGREGVVGALAILGPSAFSPEAVVQISGSSFRIGAEALRAQAAVRPALRDLLFRYVMALHSQVSQSVVCNNQHSVPSRLARWLAMGADCTESEDLPLTHELLSGMLGVRRSTVTEALMELKKAGIVKTYQGGVKIVCRSALEGVACECYSTVRMEYRRLLGPSIFQEGPGVAES